MLKKVFESSIQINQLSSRAKKGWNTELIQEIRQIQKIDHEGNKWSQKNYWGGYTSYSSTSQSFDRLHRFSTTFEKLEKKIRPHVLNFAKSLHWDFEPEDLRVSTFWANIMPRGTTHNSHHHPLSVVSGTFYIQVPVGASGIQFEDPRLLMMMAAPQRHPQAPENLQPYLTVKPKEGELILFESWMKHQVPPNPTTKDRISLSFNYDWIRR